MHRQIVILQVEVNPERFPADVATALLHVQVGYTMRHESSPRLEVFLAYGANSALPMFL